MCERRADFWKWVVSLRAGDNPRGDFIRETRALLDIDVDPGTRIASSACPEAQEELDKLEKRYQKESI